MKSQNKNKSRNSKENSQLERANAALVALKPNVTTEDRKAAFEVYSEVTVVDYLKGRGKNLDTAVALLEFFKVRIARRDELITS